jgi:PPOX class probable F420-dependent enzyme
MSSIDPFINQWAVLLTSYPRDGTPVGTPVSVAVDGDRALLRSPASGWKVKRMRNNPRVEIAPCTARGRPTGPGVHALARPLAGDEARLAARALRRKHPVRARLRVYSLYRMELGSRRILDPPRRLRRRRRTRPRRRAPRAARAASRS